MLKKWKKTIKFLGTTIIVLIYLTIGLFGDEALKGGGKGKTSLALVLGGPPTTDKYLGAVKTIIGYSREFRLRQELEERIECDAGGSPPEEDGRDGWKEAPLLGLRVFSAYYDRRQAPHDYVRIIGLLRRNSSLYCQMWYPREDGSTAHVTQKAAVHEIWSPEWGPKNSTCDQEYPAILSCPARPGSLVPPSWVSFVSESCAGGGAFVRVRAPTRPPRTKNFVICVKPSRVSDSGGDDEDDDDESLLEWLEINERLGAQEIVLYAYNATEAASALGARAPGRLLTRKEFEDPPPGSCPPRSFEDSIWHKRKMEIIAYNDCFYGNLHQTKFVIPLDVDEIIVPKTGNNWFEAFRSHFPSGKPPRGTRSLWPRDADGYASFSVRNAYFFPRYPKDALVRRPTLPKRDQNVPEKLVKGEAAPRRGSIFDRTLRSFRLSPRGDSVKSFVHVGNTLSVFNHYAFHVLGEARRQLIFPENVFQLNHYRNSCDSLLIDGCREFMNQVVYDDSLERFRRRRRPGPWASLSPPPSSSSRGGVVQSHDAGEIFPD